MFAEHQSAKSELSSWTGVSKVFADDVEGRNVRTIIYVWSVWKGWFLLMNRFLFRLCMSFENQEIKAECKIIRRFNDCRASGKVYRHFFTHAGLFYIFLFFIV